MTTAADVMARNKSKGTKCARRMGAMVFCFGMGILLNATIYQAFVTSEADFSGNTTQNDRDWAYRLQGIISGCLYIIAIFKLKGGWEELYHEVGHSIAHHVPPKIHHEVIHHDTHYAPRHHDEVITTTTHHIDTTHHL